MADRQEGAFEGWAIIELMGHRKLAGRITEALVAGAAFVRIDVPGDCEGGVSASWCPEHGTCLCPPEDKTYGECLLHGTGSNHGEPGSEWTATQFYSPAAVYCITPTTEEAARQVVNAQRPRPVRLLQKPMPSDPNYLPQDADLFDGVDDNDD